VPLTYSHARIGVDQTFSTLRLHMSSRNPTATDCCARKRMSQQINAPSSANPSRPVVGFLLR
jgi:hypothetical protein